jgi:hypothetical protein
MSRMPATKAEEIYDRIFSSQVAKKLAHDNNVFIC